MSLLQGEEWLMKIAIKTLYYITKTVMQKKNKIGESDGRRALSKF